MSKLFSLDQSDILKGGIIAILTIILSMLKEIVIDQGQLPTSDQLGNIGMVALGSGLSYLIKNFLTNSQGQLFSKEK